MSAVFIYDSLPIKYSIFTVGYNTVMFDSPNITYLASLNIADTPKLYFITEPKILYAWSKNPHGISVGVPTHCIKATEQYTTIE